MPTRLKELTARREALVARSEALRGDLLASSSQIRRSLALGRIGAAAVGALRRHPALVAGVGLAVWAVGPRRLLHVAGLGLGALTVYSQVRRIVASVSRLARPR